MMTNSKFNIKKFNLFLILVLLTNSLVVSGQNVRVYGSVKNALNNTPISFANVVIDGTSKGTTTDIDGNFELLEIKPGLYNFKCSYIGFNTEIKTEIQLTTNKNLRLDFSLTENAQIIDEIQVTANTFNKTEESPTSLRTINASEILRSPGGNRDISKVIANLPGVSSSPSFRNDIVIRGGAPNENRFFLDGIEIPNINHFATQGSSGGPVGILNVNFIREVDFYSGAFPSNRGNALSSVMELKQIEGSDEDFSASFMLGSSDAGLTINTPISEKSSLLLSARRSYLQFLFKALQLPFLPTYNDIQLKYTFKPNLKNQINVIGLAAIDNFTLNPEANEGIDDPQKLAQNKYTLNNLPVNEQWNYTLGGTWKHFFDNSNLFVVLSRSHLNNTAVKHEDYADLSSPKIIDYESQEIENKSRIEYNFRENNIKFNIGVNLEDATYLNSTQRIITSGYSIDTNFVETDLHFIKYGVFCQLSKTYLVDRLVTSVGFRIDGNSFTENTTNNNFSPRLSLSYKLSGKSSLNANLGRYYQLPAYTILGYGLNNNFYNQDAEYIQCDHAVVGLEYNPSNYSKITLETFYKQYNNYPFSIIDSISLANLGGDFGVIGNEDISSISQGRSFGLEFLAQQKLSTSIYGIMSVTYYRSEFEDKYGKLIPSAWDNRFIFNLTAGKRFKRNIELGLKFRYSGGAPYTPIDLATSSNIAIWNINQRGVLNYNELNIERLRNLHGVDLRLDKKWYFNKWSLNAYIDVENLYNYKIQLPPEVGIDPEIGEEIYTAQNSGEYSLYEIINESGTVLPSIGLLIEF
ncbi:MAG: ferric aerobactin receptor [Flavobacteriales bacterium]|nr:ferric aerobactin receptor [Flavobacteriales bacterium]